MLKIGVVKEIGAYFFSVVQIIASAKKDLVNKIVVIYVSYRAKSRYQYLV